MTIKEFFQGRFLPHPLHPMLVHLPVGLWVGSFIFDIIGLASGDPITAKSMVVTSWYCILLGAIAAVPSAAAGLAELIDIPSNTTPFRLGVTHMTLNLLLLLGYVIQLVVRDKGAPVVSTGVFVFNLIEFVVLLISGYLGGRMAYEFRIGSRQPSEAGRPPGVRRVA
jgi:uncharacterized membrane protein